MASYPFRFLELGKRTPAQGNWNGRGSTITSVSIGRFSDCDDRMQAHSGPFLPSSLLIKYYNTIHQIWRIVCHPSSLCRHKMALSGVKRNPRHPSTYAYHSIVPKLKTPRIDLYHPRGNPPEEGGAEYTKRCLVYFERPCFAPIRDCSSVCVEGKGSMV